MNMERVIEVNMYMYMVLYIMRMYIDEISMYYIDTVGVSVNIQPSLSD